MKYPFLSNHNPFSPHHFATSLQKCLKSKSLNPCKQIHALILTSGTDMNHYSLHSKLVGVYASCGCFTSAYSMFQITPNLNVFAYNWIIFSLTFNGCFEEAIKYFTLLQKARNVVPNSYTFSFLLKCCVGMRDLRKGKEVHCMVNKFGLQFDSSVVNGLIDMYCKCGCLSYARKVFDKMPEPDVVSWTNMISAYSYAGRLQESQFLFERMKLAGLEPNEFTWNALITAYARIGDCDGALTSFSKMSKTGLVPDVVTWNAMISGFVQSEKTTEAVELFRDMLVAGVKPNPITITGLLPAFGSTGSVKNGKEIHGLVYRTNMYANVFVATALIDMYSKCGYAKHARNVFNVTPFKNIASWNAMIGCYGKHGMVDSAIELLDKMEDENVQPNQVTLTCVLASCSHGGLVNKGLTLFKSMRESQRVEIRHEHYACVIDILCRSGKIEEAYGLVQELRTEVTDSMIGAFLNGCVVYNRPDLAKKVGEIVMKMEVKAPGGFVTLSNIYAGEGEWAKVAELREVMKLQGVQKQPGFSSVYNNI
ncbi:putative tetratricopeptide-like helical domain superfamily [Helianthus annuus]|nr:putative tetratricopeptide-like helical domain superfamily [Helianthus annuus]KAJ0945649.1 putative tetratricopeptide-like helical domain superfamily [Helianthus annuus]